MPTQDPLQMGAPTSLSDAISKLMENPEIISTVASALGSMSAQRPTAAKAEGSDSSANPEQSAASSASPDLSSIVTGLAPLMSGMGAKQPHLHEKNDKGSEAVRREALLCALKPYVSESRREAIDYIIRISRISELLKPNQPQ